MDVENIRYAIIVSQHKNFTSASKELAISESSLSKRIHKLEAELGGTALFTRTTRKVSLTTAGEVFLMHAKNIVNTYDDMLYSLNRINNREMNTIRMGVLPVLGKMGLSVCIARFYEAHPNVNIELHEGRSEELMLLQKYGHLDISFIIKGKQWSDSPDYVTNPIMRDRVVVVVYKDHPFAQRSCISLGELVDERLILLTHASVTRNIIDDAFNQYSLMPHKIQECAQIDMMIDLVGAKVGVALLASKVYKSSYRQDGTLMIPLKESIERVMMVVASTKPADNQKLVKAFLRHVLNDPIVKC